jgi:hypothetical protein
MVRRARAVGVAATLLLLPLACGAQSDTGANTTSTSAEPTTSAIAPSTSTVPPTTTVALSVDDRAFVVWPFPGSVVRYNDPVAAARSFAVDLVGFVDPVVGEFRAGDSRSGEVVVRPTSTGPETTVLVRRFGTDGSWWVIGSITTDIEVTLPSAQTAVDDPLQLAGRSRAFEGTVEVDIVADGSTTRIGSGFVTGGSGPDYGPFSGSMRFASPHGGWGSVILFTRSMEDGRVREASTIRVGFIGGD